MCKNRREDSWKSSSRIRRIFEPMEAKMESALAGRLHLVYPFLERGLVEELSTKGQVREFKAGELILRHGQYFKSTVLVLSGKIKVMMEDGEGNEAFMYYIEPGQACALSMICASRQEQSRISATASEDAELLLLPVSLMDDMMFRYKSWYYFVLENYRNRFEELMELLQQTIFKGLDERLVFYLKKRIPLDQEGEIRTTHEEIARDLGTSRVVISRLLKHLENEGKIVLQRNAIQIKNLDM